MFFTYLMASRPGGSLYLGHTNDIWQRPIEHKSAGKDVHAGRYKCRTLVWFEWHEDRHSAFVRERQLKKWYRDWKEELIEELNPNWDDLGPHLTEAFVYDPKRIGPIAKS